MGAAEQGGFVQQTIVLGGKLGLRRDIYNQLAKSDHIGVNEQTSRVHGDVQEAFYLALTAQEEVRLRQHLLGVALDAVETVHQLANVGQADSPDILETEVEAEQAKVEYEASQRHYLAAFHVLAAFAGKADLPIRPLQGDLEKFPELNADQIVDRIVSESPMVKRAEQEVAVAQSRLRDAKREVVPDLQIRAGEQQNGEQVAIIPVKSVGAQSFATVGINIPLWNRNLGNIEASKAETERAELAVTQERLRLRQLAEPLAQNYLSARFEAERYKKQLIPRAERAYQLYLEKYRGMAQAYPQVLVSQRTVFQLQIGYLNAMHNIWQSAIALDNYTLSGGLDAPMSSGLPSSSINLPSGAAGQE
jgi:cobalt-zinc-cadmium efflux system outer membrane protein